MDTEAFIRWALDDARNVEERYTVELLVELGVGRWNAKRKIYRSRSIDELIAISRERKLNPAYDPRYSEEDLRKAAECLGEFKQWYGNSDRPIRDLTALGFLTSLEDVWIANIFAASNLEPLTRLPSLRKLSIGSPGYDFGNPNCRDFTPLARCRALRDLTLGFNVHWPDFSGIEALDQLEQLTLSGNLLALPHGISFPKVHHATLYCMPLASRNVADLPHLPACEFLTLYGAERLDGIERMPRLRNLTLMGPFESFEPVAALKNLTCLTVTPNHHLDPEKMPRDVSPLARLPKLQKVEFGHKLCIPDMPRDYSPLTEAPALRELIVHHCPPVEVEVAAINAGLLPSEATYLKPEPEPRELPPLRMCIAPPKHHPPSGEEHRSEDEPELIDAGLRKSEEKWVTVFLQRLLDERVGHADWGEAKAEGTSRTLRVEIHSFECVAKLPLILDAIREAMSRLRDGYQRAAQISIHLRVPPRENTPEQDALYKKFQEDRDELEHEQNERDGKEYLDRLHQMELKKQEGAEINPEEFSPAERQPNIEPPWEKEDEEDEDSYDADIATKEKPAPPVQWLDDEHPLAQNYFLAGKLTLSEIWFYSHCRDVAIQLMHRQPDVEIPEEKEKQQ